ncbi:MAG: aldo/keto reductase [Alphaproteobacteria bacterium]|nr:aldo/keto reductase [Alphaproteobacteria bacterium]
MITRRLPGTALELSAIGVGCWAMGGRYWGEDVRDADSVAAIHAALDAGVNWFDTAPIYGEGHADEVLARALGPRRHEVILATKVGVRLDGPGGHAMSDLSPAHIVADAEASLRRLGVERIDLLQVHWPCERGTPLAESLGALQGLVEAGKVRHVGLCNYSASALREADEHGQIASLQAPLSLLRREAEGELLPTCRALGVGLLAYEPLCRGLLTGKYQGAVSFPDSDQRAWDERFQGARLQHHQRFVADLSRAAARLGVPTAALALGWVADRPGVTAAIVGVKRPAQLHEDLQALRLLGKARVWSVVERLQALHGAV